MDGRGAAAPPRPARGTAAARLYPASGRAPSSSSSSSSLGMAGGALGSGRFAPRRFPWRRGGGRRAEGGSPRAAPGVPPRPAPLRAARRSIPPRRPRVFAALTSARANPPRYSFFYSQRRNISERCRSAKL